MNIKISKRFVKDSEKITDKRILTKLRQVLTSAGDAICLSDIANILELSGHPGYASRSQAGAWERDKARLEFQNKRDNDERSSE